jgi:Cys-rich protein (TIGR01571 family)
MSHLKEGLFECHKDMASCLFGTFIPLGSICLQASAVNKVRDFGCWIPYWIAVLGGPIGNAVNRERIREALGRKPDFCLDCVVWCFLPWCAGCQDYREVKKHHNKH